MREEYFIIYEIIVKFRVKKQCFLIYGILEKNTIVRFFSIKTSFITTKNQN